MKLSPNMKQVLIDIKEGRGTHHKCYGMSEHGGRSRVLRGLYIRGLIDHDYKLTDDGEKECEQLRITTVFLTK